MYSLRRSDLPKRVRRNVNGTCGSPKQGNEEQLSGERDGIEILPVGGVVARWSSRIPPSRSGVASRIWPLTATTGFAVTGPVFA